MSKTFIVISVNQTLDGQLRPLSIMAVWGGVSLIFVNEFLCAGQAIPLSEWNTAAVDIVGEFGQEAPISNQFATLFTSIPEAHLSVPFTASD